MMMMMRSGKRQNEEASVTVTVKAEATVVDSDNVGVCRRQSFLQSNTMSVLVWMVVLLLSVASIMNPVEAFQLHPCPLSSSSVKPHSSSSCSSCSSLWASTTIDLMPGSGSGSGSSGNYTGTTYTNTNTNNSNNSKSKVKEEVKVGVLMLNLGGHEKTQDVEGKTCCHVCCFALLSWI